MLLLPILMNECIIAVLANNIYYLNNIWKCSLLSIGKDFVCGKLGWISKLYLLAAFIDGVQCLQDNANRAMEGG